MLQSVLMLIVLLMLSGCGSHHLRTFNAVDLADKTVTVPPGGGLTGAIKEALARDGWRIQVYRGPEITRGTTGERTYLEHFDSFNTRLSLPSASRASSLARSLIGMEGKPVPSMFQSLTGTAVVGVFTDHDQG